MVPVFHRISAAVQVLTLTLDAAQSEDPVIIQLAAETKAADGKADLDAVLKFEEDLLAKDQQIAALEAQIASLQARPSIVIDGDDAPTLDNGQVDSKPILSSRSAILAALCSFDDRDSDSKAAAFA